MVKNRRELEPISERRAGPADLPRSLVYLEHKYWQIAGSTKSSLEKYYLSGCIYGYVPPVWLRCQDLPKCDRDLT